MERLRGEYEVVAGLGHLRNQYLRENSITTYFIVPPINRYVGNGMLFQQEDSQ